MLRNLLAHPLTRGLGVDDPRTTRRRREIIRGKAFLRRLYEEWYGEILRALPAGEGPILELGSGGGFLNRFIPELITSEVRFTSGIDAALDATRLPFAPASLRAIVMTNVLHHISEPRCFFAEAARCTRPGGGVVLIEPWVSSWSTLIYRRLHEEPYLPQAESWEISGGGPLSGANGALPWILFQRDRRRFERELPEWEITRIRPMMPIGYLLSGGVSLRALAPGWAYTPTRWLERFLEPWIDHCAMFARISLRRR